MTSDRVLIAAMRYAKGQAVDDQPRDADGKWTAEGSAQHARALNRTWGFANQHGIDGDSYDLPRMERHHQETIRRSAEFPAKAKRAADRHINHVGKLVSTMRLHAHQHKNKNMSESLSKALEVRITEMANRAELSHGHLMKTLDPEWNGNEPTEAYSRSQVAEVRCQLYFRHG